MRVVAIILALAAGASGVPGPCDSAEFECKEDPYCMWLDSCDAPTRRNLRFGAAETGCCTFSCSRRLTAEETAALTAEEREERRRLC